MTYGTGGQTRERAPVRAELAKQILLIAVITAIAVWQHHFVIQAASADIYIFALLFGTAIFGCYNTIKGTFQLGNEFIALAALKQVYEDARRERLEPQDHERIIAERVEESNVVYNPPKALGTAHKLIYAELLRNGSLSIPPATMQVLVSDLETKLDERQGMAHYLGALMVLLGLLGTFIGLMHTLESVGGILGSLDLSGNGGTGAIAGLIESLKLPLEGMSTGFGASLFGLIGSLVIGVLSKFDSRVAHHLQHDFETWLRNTVQIEAARQSTHDSEATSDGDETAAPNWWAAFQIARNTVLATSRLNERQVLLADDLRTVREKAEEREANWDQRFRRLSSLLEESLLVQTHARENLLLMGEGLLEVNAGIRSLLTQGNAALQARLLEQKYVLEQNSLEMSKVNEAVSGILLHASTARDHLRSIDEQIVRASQSPSFSPLAVDKNDDLIGDLRHLISTMRLRAEDVVTVRRLSQMMRETHDESIAEMSASNVKKGAA